MILKRFCFDGIIVSLYTEAGGEGGGGEGKVRVGSAQSD